MYEKVKHGRKKKEGEPAHFGAHVIRTRQRKTGLVKRKKGNGSI